jgi:hypothetical protein
MQVGTTVLEQGARVAQRPGGAGHRRPALVPAMLSAAGGVLDLQDGRAKQIREWLFLLLRFARGIRTTSSLC